MVDGDWKTSPRMFDQDYPKENREKSKRANALSRLGLGDGFIDDCISHRPLYEWSVVFSSHFVSFFSLLGALESSNDLLYSLWVVGKIMPQKVFSARRSCSVDFLSPFAFLGLGVLWVLICMKSQVSFELLLFF